MRLYLDTMVWVYALEGNPVFGVPAQQFMRNVSAGRHVVFTSHFLLAETLVLPIRKGDTFLVTAYKRALLRSDSVQPVPFDAASAITSRNCEQSTGSKRRMPYIWRSPLRPGSTPSLPPTIASAS